MGDSSPLQSLTLNPSQTEYSLPTHRRRPLRSRTYDSFIRILSHCRPQLQMHGQVSDEDGYVTRSQILTTNILVSLNSKGSEDNVVGETSGGDTKEKTCFQDPDSMQATPTKLHQPELVRDSELESIPPSQISFEDSLVVEEQVNDCAVRTTKELENVHSVQMDECDALKNVGMDKDPSFLQLDEILNFKFCSDMVVELSEATQLIQEEGTVLAENIPKDMEHELQTKERELDKLINSSGTPEVSFCQISGEIEEGNISKDMEHELQTKEMELDNLINSSGTPEMSFCQISGEIEEGNIPKDMEHELQTKERELDKLINSSGTPELSFCQISGEIEEGEISDDAWVADESFDALTEDASLGEETTENLHDSKGYFGSDNLLFEDKDRVRQQHVMSNLSTVKTVIIESNSKNLKSRTLTEQLPDYYSQDIPPRSAMETPKSNDVHNCLDNLTLPERTHQDNAGGNQISMSTEKDEDAGKNKRKRVMTKERRAKKKKKDRIKRAEKNRELGVKRLKLPTVLKPKKIVHCRHYLQGRCHEGEKCKFSHDTVPLTKSKPCGHFARHACMKGDQCPYDHQLSKYPCNNYSLNGFCNRGSECMFSHEIAAKSLSATPSIPKHDMISPHQTVTEKQGSHPMSKINKSELKSTSPLNISNCGRPMDSCGRSHQKVISGSCSVANSPAQKDQLALKPVLRTGGQAPRGVNFLMNGAALLGDTNKDKLDESSAKRVESFGAGCNETVNVPGGIKELNGMSEVVTPRKPQGINFLSFAQPPSDDSSNKILSSLLSNNNDRMGKSSGDGMGKGKLTCSLAQGAGTSNANRQLIGTPLTVPQNVKFLSFNRSHSDASTSKENTNLDFANGGTALSFGKERQNADTAGMPSPSSVGGPSHQQTGGWSANSSGSFKTSLSGLVRNAVQSTLAFAAQLEPDIKVGSSHKQQRS